MTHKDVYHMQDGHYKGWSFFDDAIGSEPDGWTITNTVTVTQSASGVTPIHLKLAKLSAASAAMVRTITTVDKGVLELYAINHYAYLYIELLTSTDQKIIEFYFDDTIDPADHEFSLNANRSGAGAWLHDKLYKIHLAVRTNGSAALPAPDDTLAVSTCHVVINGVHYGDYALGGAYTDDDISKIKIHTSLGAMSISYVDSIGFVGEDSYLLDDYSDTLDGTEFINYCESGETQRIIGRVPTSSFVSTERIYEGEQIKVYDEGDVLIFQGRLQPGTRGNGNVYSYSAVDLAESDMNQKVYLDYSSSSTEIADIVQAAIDQVKTQVSWDAASIPDTGITIKWRFNGTLLKDVLTYLAWRANAIWYLDPSDKIYFLETDSLTDSGLTYTETSNVSIEDFRPNMSFVNAVYLTGANGLIGSGATDADLIAQYNQLTWDIVTEFSQISDQTELDAMETAILNLKGIRDPNAYVVDLIISGQEFYQEGKELKISYSYIPQLIVEKTMIIASMTHSLCDESQRIVLTEISVENNPSIRGMKSNKYQGNEIRQVKELAGNASEDVILKTVTVNGQYTGDGTGNNADWDAGHYKEIDLSAYCSSILCVMIYVDNVGAGVNKALTLAMNNDSNDLNQGHAALGYHRGEAFACRIVSGGKFQVADRGMDYNPNSNGLVFDYIAWGVMT